MTVCIGAICDFRRSLILATDQNLDFGGVYSGDAQILKVSSLHPHWAAMFSGNDITQVQPVLRTIWKGLHGHESHTLERVEQCAMAAYQGRLRQQQVNSVTSQYGFDDLESFKNEGAASLGRYFAVVRKKVENVSLGCDFLVAGFDDETTPHLFGVEHPGASRHHDFWGFASIGSGADAVGNSLSFHSYNNRMSLGLAIYHVCAAKFMAERASGVGKKTSVVIGRVTQPKGRVSWAEMRDGVLEEIRNRWEQEGQPRAPAGIKESITERLDDDSSFKSIIMA